MAVCSGLRPDQLREAVCSVPYVAQHLNVSFLAPFCRRFLFFPFSELSCVYSPFVQLSLQFRRARLKFITRRRSISTWSLYQNIIMYSLCVLVLSLLYSNFVSYLTRRQSAPIRRDTRRLAHASEHGAIRWHCLISDRLLFRLMTSRETRYD